MIESLGVIVILFVFAVSTLFLALAIRHFIPLARGFSAPLWVYPLAPFAFFTDRYFVEAARPHRKKFLLFVSLFLVTFLAMFLAFGKT
jgi:hypothetical protein